MKIAILGAQCGWGAQLPAAALGPLVFEQTGIVSALADTGREVTWEMWGTDTPYQKDITLDYTHRLNEITVFNQQLTQHVKNAMAQSYFPIVMGGDHAIAMGTWRGVISALDAQGRFGLIWIDAHMDSHTPETSYSQAIHGMPLAALMGCWGEMGAQLNPRHVVLIGVRSFEPEEAALLEKLHVTVFYSETVKEIGFSAVFAQALQKVTHDTQGFGISIDLDAFDPLDAPGVGSPEKDGLRAQEVLPVLKGIGQHALIKGIEIAEFNPERDIEGKTAQLAKTLLLNMMEQDPAQS